MEISQKKFHPFIIFIFSDGLPRWSSLTYIPDEMVVPTLARVSSTTQLGGGEWKVRWILKYCQL